MVVGALMGVAASSLNGGSNSGIVDFFHGLQPTIMVALMLSVTQFVYWTCAQRRKRGSLWDRQGPTFLCAVASVLVNVQPIAILAIGSWKLCCAKCADLGLSPTCTSTGYTYPPYGDDMRECSAPGGNIFWDESYCKGQNYALFPTVWQGWMIQIICTWGGYILMFFGVFQATQLHVKLAKRWRQIRSGR
mmetsp:Transcript_21260/g.51403  ORF Transcript_21260/g.51403 Transcript_21260/m.51403 type:complete len:190 (-) Transcript_21260:576-1145(-)